MNGYGWTLDLYSTFGRVVTSIQRMAKIIKLSQGLGTRDTVEFFAMDLLDPRQVIENVLLEIDCLPTWSWSDDPYYSWHEGQFAHESNFKCSMSFMQSLKG